MAIISSAYQFLMEMMTDLLQALNLDGFAVVISHPVFTADVVSDGATAFLLADLIDELFRAIKFLWLLRRLSQIKKTS